MSEIVYELVCDSCGGDYELTYIDGITNHNEPMYCPFCGAEIDLTDVEEEDEYSEGDDYPEIDFDEEDR